MHLSTAAAIVQNLMERSQPAFSGGKIPTMARFAGWQLRSRLIEDEMVFPFVSESKLLAKRGFTSSTIEYYLGLDDPPAAAFILHYLRPGDLFADVGANIGVYSVLASSVCQARSIAFEPSSSAFAMLQRNVQINAIAGLVDTRHLAVGSTPGSIRFEAALSTCNRVVTGSQQAETEEVARVTLDDALTETPVIIKADVMGYEPFVVEGAQRHLADPQLAAVILGTARHAPVFGLPRERAGELLAEFGFALATYDARQRALTWLEEPDYRFKSLYVRRTDAIATRLKEAPQFTVHGRAF